MLSTERIEVLLCKFPLDNSSGPPHNRSILAGVTVGVVLAGADLPAFAAEGVEDP